jgi:hypothetical protein
MSQTKLAAPPGAAGLPVHTDERRTRPRVSVALSAEERIPGMQVVWTTTDLSVAGLSMRDSFSRPAGTRLRLKLHLEDGQSPLQVTGEVVGSFDEEGGMRVRFISLPAEGAARIHSLLESARAA